MLFLQVLTVLLEIAFAASLAIGAFATTPLWFVWVVMGLGLAEIAVIAVMLFKCGAVIPAGKDDEFIVF